MAAKDFDNVIRLNLEHLKNPDKVSFIFIIYYYPSLFVFNSQFYIGIWARSPDSHCYRSKICCQVLPSEQRYPIYLQTPSISSLMNYPYLLDLLSDYSSYLLLPLSLSDFTFLWPWINFTSAIEFMLLAKLPEEAFMLAQVLFLFSSFLFFSFILFYSILFSFHFILFCFILFYFVLLCFVLFFFIY